MTKCCADCVHERPRKPRRTYLEHYEADTRPERPKGFWAARKALTPEGYRQEHPYEDDVLGSIHKHFDEIEIAARESDLICTLNPKHIIVKKSHYCGQFRPKPNADIIKAGKSTH